MQTELQHAKNLDNEAPTLAPSSTPPWPIPQCPTSKDERSDPGGNESSRAHTPCAPKLLHRATLRRCNDGAAATTFATMWPPAAPSKPQSTRSSCFMCGIVGCREVAKATRPSAPSAVLLESPSSSKAGSARTSAPDAIPPAAPARPHASTPTHLSGIRSEIPSARARTPSAPKSGLQSRPNCSNLGKHETREASARPPAAPRKLQPSRCNARNRQPPFSLQLEKACSNIAMPSAVSIPFIPILRTSRSGHALTKSDRIPEPGKSSMLQVAKSNSRKRFPGGNPETSACTPLQPSSALFCTSNSCKSGALRKNCETAVPLSAPWRPVRLRQREVNKLSSLIPSHRALTPSTPKRSLSERLSSCKLIARFQSWETISPPFLPWIPHPSRTSTFNFVEHKPGGSEFANVAVLRPSKH
mmetsp:Transcript_112814/g.224419  ORF Transcript_112814/g.224419 Transcript_112814/m.224419 type:complete len:415 (+) Transcript_112814:86-1330(+)